MVYSPRWGRSKVSLPFRWISQVIKTLALLYRERPAVVFVMTPPVVACLPIFLYARLARISYVIDAHSGAFIDERWRRMLDELRVSAPYYRYVEESGTFILDEEAMRTQQEVGIAGQAWTAAATEIPARDYD